MKVIQIPYCFYPESVGGTEIYVKNLSYFLQKSGIDTVITAPTEEPNNTYFYNGLKIKRFNISNRLNDLSELYGEGDVKGAIEFGKILDEENPDLVHLHAFTHGASLRLVHESKKRGIPTIFTYHTPTVSCQRGTLMRWGKNACDGKLNTRVCTQCTLHSLGLPRGVADIFGWLPAGIGYILRRIHLSGGVWTAMRMRGLISTRHTIFNALMTEVDCVIVVCDWAREVLLRNNVPEEKVTSVKHGIFEEKLNFNKKRPLSTTDKPLRVLYIGRLNPEKGVDILIKVIKSLPKRSITLDIYGDIQGEAEQRYLWKLKRLAKDDSRIVFKNTVPNDRIILLLKNYHILAVPSQWVETGPLVVLEAFAAGIPVIGSNLGGIAELVKHGTNGLLVEAGSVKEWLHWLQRICEDRGLLANLQAGIYPVRRTEEMAEEVITIYNRLLDKNRKMEYKE